MLHLGDPKAPSTSHLKHDAIKQDKKTKKTQVKPASGEEEQQLKDANEFMLNLPYREDTVFGYIVFDYNPAWMRTSEQRSYDIVFNVLTMSFQRS